MNIGASAPNCLFISSLNLVLSWMFCFDDDDDDDDDDNDDDDDELFLWYD